MKMRGGCEAFRGVARVMEGWGTGEGIKDDKRKVQKRRK